MRMTSVVVSGLVVASSVCSAQESDYNLGVDAYHKKHYAEAAAQWKKAVARGDVDAMNNLAYLLYNGYGVPKDLDAAVNLWRTASFAGMSEAQWHLGNAYEAGVGVPQSLSKAYAWYRCSMESASSKVRSKQSGVEIEGEILKDASDSLNRLVGKLDSSELAHGQALAAEYIARYGRPVP